ncbi:hypothetical protein Tco_1388617 [Tanacetum coccineum]
MPYSWDTSLTRIDIEIKDMKGKENVTADHLSRIENDEASDDNEVDDNFLGETLMKINAEDEPWFADFANYFLYHEEEDYNDQKKAFTPFFQKE